MRRSDVVLGEKFVDNLHRHAIGGPWRYLGLFFLSFPTSFDVIKSNAFEFTLAVLWNPDTQMLHRCIASTSSRNKTFKRLCQLALDRLQADSAHAAIVQWHLDETV